MPRLDNFDQDDLTTRAIPGSNFSFSGERVERLGALEYTLVTIVCDKSGSVDSYKDGLEKAVGAIVESCRLSKRSDNLLLRLLTFNESIEEIHGYKMLPNCNPDDYKNFLECNGWTALRDATYQAIKATEDYGKHLLDNNMDVNAVIFIITDGQDNRSTFSNVKIQQAIEDIKKCEGFQSITTLLVGLELTPEDKKALEEFKANASLDKFEDIGNATPAGLAKLVGFVSKSISSVSVSLQTGASVVI